MAKFCTNCGKELDENAALCMNCGKLVDEKKATNNAAEKKKKKGLPGWAIALIVVGCVCIVLPIIGIILFATVFSDEVNDITNEVNDIINNTNGGTVYGTIDDTLESENLKLKLTGAYMYDSVGSGYFVQKAKEGKEFLVFFFEVENTSSENKSISTYNFDGYVDGYSVNNAGLYTEIDGNNTLSGSIASGMKLLGYVAYEIDETWEKFEVHFTENRFLDSSKTLVFKVVNSD